jgi:branched-chain amino acid transport system ATP-binding protein
MNAVLKEAPAATEILIDARDIHVSYGRIEALKGVSLSVGSGEVVAVVGANGAGKTTLLRTLSDMIPTQSGSVLMCGLPLPYGGPHKLARHGLLHIPEGRGTLQTLTVLDNLQIAFDVRPTKDTFESALKEVYRHFPRLEERCGQLAGNLSGGEQQMLALARAIINRPRLLLLDEPSLGLSPRMVSEAYRTLRDLKAQGLTILLVEQNVKLALRFADRAYVLRQGRVVRQGLCQELLQDPNFVAHYLGTH